MVLSVKDKAFVVISDTHLGLSNDKDAFHDNMELFYRDSFFPFLEKNRDKIRGVIHAGDLFHDRRRINVQTMARAREYFFDPLKALDLQMHVVIGNHDIYYRERVDLNTVDELIDMSYTNITPVTHPMKLTDNTSLIPWIARQNRQEVMDYITEDDAEYAFGHFELNGFNYSRVSVAEHGDDAGILSKYKQVYSGHYHYRQTKGNVTYLGAPTQHTWVDAGTPTGFHLFHNGKLKAFDNPYPMFTYEEMDGEPTATNPRYVRLRIPADATKSQIAARTAELQESGAIDVAFVQEKIEQAAISKSGKSGDASINVEDTPAFIKNQVQDPEIAKMLIDVYHEAMELTGAV